MAVNLINSNDIEVEQTGQDIQLNLTQQIPIIDNTISTSSTNGIENQAITKYVNNIKGSILWTNPNPTSAITSDTNITLSSDDYDILEIFYKVSTSNDQIMSVKTIKGYPSRITIPNASGGVNYRPLTRTSDTSYTIGTLTPNSDNALCIPLYIIGYKTGLFNV